MEELRKYSDKIYGLRLKRRELKKEIDQMDVDIAMNEGAVREMLSKDRALHGPGASTMYGYDDKWPDGNGE